MVRHEDGQLVVEKEELLERSLQLHDGLMHGEHSRGLRAAGVGSVGDTTEQC